MTFPIELIPTWATAAFSFAWGAIWGSFLNVVIVRWPDSIVRPGSRCPSCEAPIRAYDNVPILSYLFLGGRCRRCKTRVSPRYLMVELLTGLLTVALFHSTVIAAEGPMSLRLSTFVALFACTCALVTVSFIDLDRRLIPDVITIPGCGIGLAFSLVNPAPGWFDAAIGAAAGYLVVWLLFHHGWKALRGQPGMMMGDAKLLAMIGAFLGWQGALFSLLAGAMVGSVAGITLALLAKRTTEKGAPGDPGVMRTAVPFGPFLSLGALVYIFYGPPVVDWYLSLGEVLS